jgi:glycine dehydrogenase subunit 1
MAGFIPIQAAERADMLRSVGIADPESLFAVIPEEIRLRELPADPLLAEPWPEMSIQQHLHGLAAQNLAAAEHPCFLGAGAYDHYQPAIIHHLLQRQEFMTAYTPYQPEISQGTLQAIFEFQSYICRLTELDVSNSSMYDGASAAAEALLMACRATGRSRVWVSGAVHPHTRQVIRTYIGAIGIAIDESAYSADGSTVSLLPADCTGYAATLVQSPNFFGIIEDLAAQAESAHQAGALAVASCDPLSLALLRSPGSCGIDIAVGEAQPLGNSLAFGGPYVGYLAAREVLLRKMPGRIAGETVDRQGRRCFVLTIQAREQHIRREKATSNICTNQALCALAATIYLATQGQTGLTEAARQTVGKSAWLRAELIATGLFAPVFTGPYFREFVLRFRPDRSLAGLNRWLAGNGLIGGLDLGQVDPGLAGCWLLAVTEKRSRTEMAHLVGLCQSYAAFGHAELEKYLETKDLGLAGREEEFLCD